MGLVKAEGGTTIVHGLQTPSPTACKAITSQIREEEVILCEVLGPGQADESVYCLMRKPPVSTCNQRITWLSVLGSGEVFAPKLSQTQEAPT